MWLQQGPGESNHRPCHGGVCAHWQKKKKGETFKEAKKPSEEQAEREKVPAMGKDGCEQQSNQRCGRGGGAEML